MVIGYYVLILQRYDFSPIYAKQRTCFFKEKISKIRHIYENQKYKKHREMGVRAYCFTANVEIERKKISFVTPNGSLVSFWEQLTH